MKTSQARRALRARQRFLRDPFFRSSHQQLEHLEQRRLLSASPLATDSPDESPVDPAWFVAVADPAETTRMGTRFLDHAATSQLPSSQVDLSRWIVKLSDDLVAQYPTPASANALFSGSEMEVLSGLGLPGQLLVGAHCTTTGQALEFFANEPGILYYEADTVQLASVIPSDPLFYQQIGLHNTGQDGGTVDADIDAPAAWEITQGHANVVVAIIDTGIDLDHPDLKANIWTNPGEIPDNGIDDDGNGKIDDIHGWDFRNNDADPDDDHRHGTHVAGTVGAVGNNGVGVAGIAWHTTLMPLKFLDHNNTGFTSDAVEAINYATLMRTRAENPVNVRVINNSYNGQFSNALADAISASAAADILFVVASGNGNALGKGYDIDTDPVYPAGIDSPNSLVVGASGQFDELGRFSNYGVATVDLVAPGVGIVSTLPESMGSYGALSGTSMATPLVSGTAALIAANLPDITTAEIKTAILNTVDPLAELAGKVASGGRLNAAAAVAVDTYRPRVTLVSSNQVDSTGELSYPLQVTLRDNVALDLATLDNNDLRLLGPTGQQLNTVISHDTTSGPTNKEKTVTYQVEAPAGGWDSSFNGLYNLVAVAGQIGDTNSNTNLLTQLGEFEVEISLAGPMDVNSTDDLVDIDLGDDISNAGDNKSTLRSAIMQANATPGLDTIQVPGGTYTLTLAGAGEDGATTGDLDINESVILVGEGIDSTIINANTLDRVFDVAADATLTLQNMTVTGGAVTGNGGGIQALGNVILENVVLQGNAASGGTADGGGIYAEQGLNVTTSSITGNTADADGGGIYGKQGLNVTTTSITGNTAGGGGGGIRLSGSTSSNRLQASLIAGNTAASFGGGLYTTASRSLTAENVTFSDNEADKGGAIQATNTIAPLLLNNVTITNNRAAQEGGGIRSTGTGVKPRNTIIAANTSTGGHGNVDIDGIFASRNNNLIGIPGDVTAFTDGELGDLVGVTPALTPLGDFGGPTLVHSLVVGSPAIDAGTFQSVPSHDQRGIVRPQDGDGVGEPVPDIGAMEFILHGEIHGIKFHDRNQDGTQDPGEEGLEGWTMYLDSNDNGVLNAAEPETTTAADGSYSFLGLLPGDHEVSEVMQANWVQTLPVAPDPDPLSDPSVHLEFFSRDLHNNGAFLPWHRGYLLQPEGDTGTTVLQIPAILSDPVLEGTLSFDYTLVHGTTDADDFSGPLSGTLTIPAGASSGTIEILIQGDTETEPVEDFRIELSNPQGVILGTTEATVRIIDNDYTFTVDTEDDTLDANPGDGSALDAGGKTSLRAAILEANALDGFQSIFVPEGNYVLTRTGADEDLGATGDLDITASDLAILGAGTDLTTINGAGLDRILDLKDAANVHLVGLTLTEGAIPVQDPWTGEDGGAVRSRNSHLSLYQVTVRGNTATSDGGGIAVIEGSDLRMIDSRVTDNVALNYGGGVAIEGGTAVLDHSRVDNNRTSEDRLGGGISSWGRLLVTGSVIHDNSARQGGGIYAVDEAVIETSLLVGNQARTGSGQGGGLYLDDPNNDPNNDPGNFLVSGSSIYENTSHGGGGGVYVSGTTVIDNTTIARNAAIGDGGGIVASLADGITTTVTASTITENNSGGAGGGLVRVGTTGTLAVNNTIIAGNTAIANYPDVKGAVSSLGYNLVGILDPATDAWDSAAGDLDGTPSTPLDAGFDQLSQFRDRFSSPDVQCQLHNVYEMIDTWWDDGQSLCEAGRYQPPFSATQYPLAADSLAVDAGDNDLAGELDGTGGARLAFINTPSFSPNPIPLEIAHNARDVYSIDLDGDNDLDVLSASYGDDKIAWYENDGNQAFTTRVITTDADGAFSVYAADVDGDGDIDVLSASMEDDKIAWYENDGNQAFTTRVITTDADGASSVYAADVDGDGDIDVLSASMEDDKIAWYENDGNQAFTTHIITTAADGAYSVYAADIDGDGDMDILSASYGDDKIAWYENDGNQAFTTHVITTDADMAQSVYAADIDGDGDMDILSASFIDDKIAWYENDGAADPTFTTHVITTDADGARSVYATDVDGDGDMDILSASGDSFNGASNIAWYENDGDQNFTTRIVTTTAANGAFSVYAADVDDDGDIDIFSASGSDSMITWFENDGGENFATHFITTGPPAQRINAADLNGDGDMDILHPGGSANKITWHDNDGAGNFTTHAIGTSVDRWNDVDTADLDDDGDMDIISGGTGLAWYENSGSTTPIFTEHIIPNQTRTPMAVHVSDLDHDGDLDIITGTWQNEVAWLENDGNLNFTLHIVTTGAKNVHSVYTADVDNDGDIDLLTAESANDRVVWYENDGNQVFTLNIVTSNADGAKSVYAADVDGDGDMDILSAASNADIIAWHENDGAANPSFTEHILSGTNGAYDVYATDVDSDGDMDIMSASYDSQAIYWYQNDGSQNFNTHTVTNAFGKANSVYATDLNGDGNVDILSSGAALVWHESIPTPDIGAVELKHVDPPVLSRSVTLQPGDISSNTHFGNVALPGRISGVQYFDTNGDGNQQADEPGIDGWQMFLDTNANDTYDDGEPTTTTDLLGHYEFDHLDPMQNYTVGAVARDGWQQISPEIKPFPAELGKLLPIPPYQNTPTFGLSLALSENTAIVGAVETVYITTFDGLFHESYEFPASVHDQMFGRDVDISTNSAIVGADQADGVGAVYIFQELAGTWQETGKLTASDSAAGDRFGFSVAISGNTAIIGAPYNDDHRLNPGAAYIFHEIDGNWQEIGKLTASDSARNHIFGLKVAISGNTAVISNNQGTAYVFEKTNQTWNETQKLEWGGSITDVAISGNTIVIGDAASNSDGTARVFEKEAGSWIETATLLATDLPGSHNSDQRFGWSVSVADNIISIGTLNLFGSLPDRAYLFEKTDGAWTGSSRLETTQAQLGEGFGVDVAISGQRILVGCSSDDGIGSAYIFGSDPGFHQVSVTAGSQTTHDFGSKHLPATIEGNIYQDLDLDGLHDVHETVPEGSWTVFIDQNGNKSKDPTEPATIAAADGSYQFTDLEPYTAYTLYQVPREETHLQTAPRPPTGTFLVNPLVQAHTNNPLAKQLSDLASAGNDNFYFTGLDEHGRGFNSQELFQYDAASQTLSVLAAVNQPAGLVADDTHVYWLDRDQDGNSVIMRRGPDDISNEVLYPRTESDTQLINPVDMVLVGSDSLGPRLAVLDGDGGRIWDVLVGTLSNTITPLGPLRYLAGAERQHRSLLHLEGDVLYVADPGLANLEDIPAGIAALPLAGGSWTTLYSGSLAEDVRGLTGAYQTLVYSRGNEVYYLELDDNPPTPALMLSDPRFGHVGNLLIHDEQVFAVDTTARDQAVAWAISWDSLVTATEDRFGWNVTPVAGETVQGIDFGNVDYDTADGASAGASTISGRIYRDTNGNRLFDAGESGLAGITVFLDQNNNSLQDDNEPSTLTMADNAETTDQDEAGIYVFSGLTAGTYSVTVVPPASLQQIGPLETEFAISSLQVLDGPRASASGDFNGDGMVDLVVGSGISNQLEVFLNADNGDFADPVPYTTGHGPSDIAVADLDNDGHLDLVTANINSATVSLLAGNADGTFNTAQTLVVGSMPTGVQVADVNQDGYLDILVSNEMSDSVSVLRGKEGGGFETKTDFPAGDAPQGLVLLDFNKDGYLDLAVPNFDDNQVTLLTNDGTGTYATTSQSSVGQGPFAISAGDLNGDGHTDMVVANVLDDEVSLLLANGSGGFGTAIAISAGLGSTGTALVDVDHDGDLDIAVSNFSSTNVSVLINHGNATFQTPVSYGVGAFFYALPFDVIADDLNNDGNQDFVVTNSTENELTLLTNQLGPAPVMVAVSGVDIVDGQDVQLHTALAPTIGPLGDIEVNENSAPLAIALRGMTAGLGETQPMKVEVSIVDGTLVSQLTVDYTDPANTGTLNMQPAVGKLGSSLVTVTVTDGGPDGNLATTADNMYTTESFNYTLLEVNDPPTIASIPDPADIDEDADEQTINFTGVTAGIGETQHLAVTATSNNTSLIPDPTVIYTDGQATGSLKYTPLADAFGTAVVTVTVTDGGDDNNLATAGDNLTTSRQFTVNVTGVNDIPTLATVSNPAAIDEDAAQQTVDLTGITAGGGETQHLAVSATSNNPDLIPDPTVIYTDGQATGSLKYTPVTDASGTAVITVTVTDGGLDNNLATGDGNSQVTQTFTVNVTGVNDTPTLATITDPAAIDEDADEQTVNFTGVTAGGGETQHLAVSATSNNPALIPNPTVIYTDGQATGSLKYTPLADASGTAVVTVTVTDGGDDNKLETTDDNLSIIGTVTITVTGVNDAPTLATITDPATIDEDAAQQTVDLTGITAGGGETQHLAVSATSSNTSLVPDPTVIYTDEETIGRYGSLTYTPVANASGSAVITVTVTDGGDDNKLETTGDNLTTTEQFTVNVNPLNDPPTLDSISNQSITDLAPEQTIDLSGITSGPGEAQHLAVTASSSNINMVPDPTIIYTDGATVGSLKYKPTVGVSGSTTITVIATDAGLDNSLETTADNSSIEQTFTIIVSLGNALPTLAGINTTTIDEDAPLQTINLANISPGGDEQQPLSIIVNSSNTNLIPDPTVTYTSPQATGSIAFQPVADAHGSTEITISVTDGGPDLNLVTASDNATLQQTFTINVTSVNDKPVAADTSFEPTQDITISVDAAQGLLAIGSDVEDNPLSFTIEDGTDHGVLTTSADGSFTYQPNQGFNRTDFFTYRLDDGQAEHNLSDLAQVDFHIDTQRAWYNCLKPLDVNDDTFTTPLDVLWIINSLNADGSRTLVNARPKPLVAPFYDVNKDGFAAPLDALIIINALNQGAAEGEGASPGSYHDAPLSTAPVRSAASTAHSTTKRTTPAATQLLPQDDAFRSQLAAEELAELVPADVDQDEETWRDALDQLLAEDLELFPGDFIEDDLLR